MGNSTDPQSVESGSSPGGATHCSVCLSRIVWVERDWDMVGNGRDGWEKITGLKSRWKHWRPTDFDHEAKP